MSAGHWGLAGALALVLGGCAGRMLPVEPGTVRAYQPDRRDYARFRASHPDRLDDLLEPNYLPFMLHRFRVGDPRGDALIVCRWDDSAMPLPVTVVAPRIPEAIQDEFHPVAPATYVARVENALRAWERELEGRVRFRLVDAAGAARLRLRLRGEVAPTPGERVQVLGTTKALRTACEARGWAVPGERLAVRFQVPELSVYVADQTGVLTPDQVESVAMHEIGHALGMTGHSPIPSDFMYRMVRERPTASGLSSQDVNSFLSLYQLPNGTVFGFVDPADPGRADPQDAVERPSGAPPSGRGPPGGAPVLAAAPHVDARHGYELRPPSGWLRLETERGFFTANGPIWDRDASIELLVWPHATIEAFLGRFAPTLFTDTWLVRRAELRISGRRALQIAVEDAAGAHLEESTMIELGDGRVMLVLSRCPVEDADAWRAWFRAVLDTLEVWR